MSPLAAALTFICPFLGLPHFLHTGAFLLDVGDWATSSSSAIGGHISVSLPFLDLYFSLASSFVSLFASIVCKTSGICPFNSSFIHFRSALGVEIRVSYISDP